MKTNTSKEKKFYTQGQRFAARILFILWLLASVNPESVLAIPKRQPATTSPGDPSPASTAPLPGGALELPPDSPGAFWGDSIGSSPSTDAGLQSAHGLRARTLDKLVASFWSPRPQATPRPLGGPVAEGVTEVASTQRPLQALQARIAQGDIASTGDLVTAINSTQNPQEREVLEEWLAAYIGHFSHQSVQDLVSNHSTYLLEYNQLTHICPLSERTKELLRSYFVELSRKIEQEAHLDHSLPLMESLVCALNKLDKQVFGNNSAPLIWLANKLLARVDPGEVIFSASGYPTHGTSLDALHQVLSLVGCLDPSWDSTDKEGIYQRFKGQLEAIEKAAQEQEYYPISYHTQLLRQSLSSLELNKKEAQLKDICRRTFSGIQCLGCLYQGLRGLLELELELDALKEAYDHFQEALRSERIEKQAWYSAYQALRLSSLLSRMSQDSEAGWSYYQAFESHLDEFLARRVARWRKLFGQEGRKALRYGIVQELVSLALYSRIPSVRRGSVERLQELSDPDVWGEKADVLRALLEGLADVAVYEGIDSQERSMARGALEDIVSGASADQEVTSWLEGQSLDQKLGSRPVSSSRPAGRELFEAVQGAIARGFKPEVDLTPVLEPLADIERRLARIPSVSGHHRLAKQISELHAKLSQSQASRHQDRSAMSLDDNPAFKKLLSKIASIEEEVRQGASSDQLEGRLDSVQAQLSELQAILAGGLPRGSASLSPAELQEIHKSLVAYYSGSDFPYVPSLFEEQSSKHVKDLECQLMLREKKLAKQETKEASGDREDQVASHHMRLEEVKTPIALQDLFKARSVRPDKPVQAVDRILLTGDPGTGKTTVSKKLAYLWSEKQWGQEFHSLYLLPVRNLKEKEYDGTRYNRDKTLSTAIVNNCFIPPSNEDEYKRLRDHIEEELKQPTTLVILDGLDERAGASEEILRQAQSGSHKLLMLSRPYGVDTERRIVTIEIEHVGFNREQLEGYVRQEVSDSEQASALLSYIDKHTNVRSIAHVPVNLAILCALWQDASCGAGREELEQGSLPVLYRKFTEYTWRRYKERTSEGVSVQGRKDLFSKLGQIALAALEQGEVLISPGLIEEALSNSETDADEVKARCKDAGFLLLRSIDEKFYQFPHLTFQEYFAGCALARQLLSEKKKDQRLLRKFVSKHKYESQYGRTLTFMAGEVSRIGEFEGIQNLLGLLGKSDKEIVGVQHLLLQLRVLHEWLCLLDEDVEEDLAELSEEFKLHSCLEHWFDKAFGHIRREGYEAGSTGDKLLQLLVSSLATFGSVSVHARDLLKPLKQAAQDYNVHVRRSALKSLGQLVSSSPSHVPSMRDILLRAAQDRDTDYVRPVGLEVLGQAVAASPGEFQVILDRLAQAAQEGDAYARPGALAALGQVVAASPGHLEVPETLLKAVQDEHQDVRQAAVSALGQVAAAAPDKAPALLERLYQAAQDEDGDVRAAALKSLGQAIAAIPDKASGILEQLYQAAEDEYWSVRQAAASALGQAVAAVPHEAPDILEKLYQAAQDSDADVRASAFKSLGQAVAAAPGEASAILDRLSTALEKEGYVSPYVAALTAFGEIAKAAPRHASAMLETLLSALQDKDDDVRQAAVSALGQVAEAAPDKAPVILASLRQATQDEDADVRQIALHKLPLQELLEQYFTAPSTNSILIPHITARLCHTPLVIGNKSSGEDHRQVILYATAGAPEIQNHPSDVVKDFVDRIASSASQTDQRFPCQMGKPDWERYYGAVGEEPLLPDGLEAIMDSDCPFWPGNKVGDTHLLALIPEQVSDKPLTLDYLGELIKSPQGVGHKTQYRGDWYAQYVRPSIGNQVSGSSYWVLMTRDVLPGSRWKSYADQCALVSDHANRTGLPYEVPGALEAAVVMLLHHVRSGERLYSDNPYTYTRCRDKATNGNPVVVGGFSSGGLNVSDFHYDDNYDGVAGLRKF